MKTRESRVVILSDRVLVLAENGRRERVVRFEGPLPWSGAGRLLGYCRVWAEAVEPERLTTEQDSIKAEQKVFDEPERASDQPARRCSGRRLGGGCLNG